MLNKIFGLQAAGTNVKTEVLAGLTTFMTMAYIIALNPTMLALTGMPKDSVMTATILVCVFGTLAIGLYAKSPYAIAPGMGVNAFFTFTICMGMGKSWQFALTATALTGVIFFILCFFDLKKILLDSIPDNLKKAIGVGIGLFITLIGLSSVGIVIRGHEGGPTLSLGNLHDPIAYLALLGIILAGTLIHFDVKGAFAISVISITVLGIPIGITSVENFKILSMPASLEPIAFKLDYTEIFSFDMLTVVFVNLFVVVFDSLGSLIGLANKAKLTYENGNIKHFKKCLRVDAVSAMVAGTIGCSTTCTFVESASGIAQGGRTGLTAVTVAMFFFASLFFSPLFMMIPTAATAPALVIVGVFMISSIIDINFKDMEEALPAFLTIVTMPFTYSIYNGVAIGIISYVFIKILSGQIKSIPIFSIVLSAIFVIKYVM